MPVILTEDIAPWIPEGVGVEPSPKKGTSRHIKTPCLGFFASPVSRQGESTKMVKRRRQFLKAWPLALEKCCRGPDRSITAGKLQDFLRRLASNQAIPGQNLSKGNPTVAVQLCFACVLDCFGYVSRFLPSWYTVNGILQTAAKQTEQ